MITNLNVTKKHNARGITLITLVITVIVLLILAGVSINGILGQGSIVNQAKDAKAQANNRQEEESISAAIAHAVGRGNLSRDAIQEEIGDLIEPPIIGNGPWIVTGESGIEYTIDLNGEVTGGDMSVVESVSKKGQVLSETSTVTLQDSLGNYLRVPKRFKIASDSGNNVPDGVVIEDKDGNQFVWVPVGEVKKDDGTTVKIPLGRYDNFTMTSGPKPKQDVSKGYVSTTKEHLIDTYFYEFADDNESTKVMGKNYENTKAKDIKAFVKSANTNGGYYIGRYEAGAKDGTAKNEVNLSNFVSKSGATVWNKITQPNAAKVCQNMYGTGAGVESDLMNSYAWDTAIIYIQQCGSNSTYYNQSGKSTTERVAQTGQGKLASPSGGEQSTEDKQCNIYDMAGNVREWTTESSTSSSGPCVSRGGCYGYTTDTTSYYDYRRTSDTIFYIGFRSILYL